MAPEQHEFSMGIMSKHRIGFVERGHYERWWREANAQC